MNKTKVNAKVTKALMELANTINSGNTELMDINQVIAKKKDWIKTNLAMVLTGNEVSKDQSAPYKQVIEDLGTNQPYLESEAAKVLLEELADTKYYGIDVNQAITIMESIFRSKVALKLEVLNSIANRIGATEMTWDQFNMYFLIISLSETRKDEKGDVVTNANGWTLSNTSSMTTYVKLFSNTVLGVDYPTLEQVEYISDIISYLVNKGLLMLQISKGKQVYTVVPVYKHIPKVRELNDFKMGKGLSLIKPKEVSKVNHIAVPFQERRLVSNGGRFNSYQARFLKELAKIASDNDLKTDELLRIITKNEQFAVVHQKLRDVGNKMMEEEKRVLWNNAYEPSKFIELANMKTDIDYELLNIMNSIKIRFKANKLKYIKQYEVEDDKYGDKLSQHLRKVQIINHYVRTELVTEGYFNNFFDFRRRIYSDLYGVNIQGTAYEKAMIRLIPKDSTADNVGTPELKFKKIHSSTIASLRAGKYEYNKLKPEHFIAIDIMDKAGLAKKDFRQVILEFVENVQKGLNREWFRNIRKSLDKKEDNSKWVYFRETLKHYYNWKKGDDWTMPIFKDFSASGIQILSALVGCKKGMQATALLPNDNGKFEFTDPYEVACRNFSSKFCAGTAGRKFFKGFLMVWTYGGGKVLKISIMDQLIKYFNQIGKDIPEYYFDSSSKAYWEEADRYFANIEAEIQTQLPGIYNLRQQFMEFLKQDSSYFYNWKVGGLKVFQPMVMTNRRDIDMSLTQVKGDKANVFKATLKGFEYKEVGNVEDSNVNVALLPNITHSLDAYVLSKVVKECYKQGFDVLTVHDCFGVLPQHVMELIQIVRNVMADLVTSDVLESICRDVSLGNGTASIVPTYFTSKKELEEVRNSIRSGAIYFLS